MRHVSHARQRAQIAIVAPFAIIALVSILGLVLDFGIFRIIDSELENAAGAAALAAVWYDPDCPVTDPRGGVGNTTGYADTAAEQFAQKNFGVATVLCGSTPTIDHPVLSHPINQPNALAVTVIVHCDAGYLAGRLLGLGSVTITRWGTAAIGNAVVDGTSWKMGTYLPPPGGMVPPVGSPNLIAGLVPL